MRSPSNRAATASGSSCIASWPVGRSWTCQPGSAWSRVRSSENGVRIFPSRAVDELPPRDRAECAGEPDRLQEGREGMRTAAGIAAVRRADGVAGGRSPGGERFPVALGRRRPARLAVARNVAIEMHQSWDPAVSTIGCGRDHHPAVAVAHQRRAVDVGAIEEPQYVVCVRVEVGGRDRRGVVVRPQTGQCQGVNGMTGSAPAAEPPPRTTRSRANRRARGRTSPCVSPSPSSRGIEARCLDAMCGWVGRSA